MPNIFNSNPISDANQNQDLRNGREPFIDSISQTPFSATKNSLIDTLIQKPSLKKTVFYPPVAKLFQTYKDFYKKQADEVDEAPIHVDEIASRVAFIYEKVRTIVDWKEEHLVRRGAIERILKRKMITKISGIGIVSGFDPYTAAEPLVLELIRGGHFPNDKIPFKKINDVAKVLEKYVYILENNPISMQTGATPKLKQEINLYNWLLEIAACEIEETIQPAILQNALIQCMVESMLARIQLKPQNLLEEKDKALQVYIAVLRTLFNLDEPIVTYYLLKIKYPDWLNASPEFLKNASEKILQIEKDLQKDLSHPMEGQFFNLCETYDTVYLLLGDALKNYEHKPSKIDQDFAKPRKFTSIIKKAYEKRLSTLKRRLNRSALFSTLSVLLSGAASLYILEVPIAKLVYGEWKPTAIAVDILLPTFYMAVLVLIVKPPRKSNLDRVIKEAKKVVFAKKEKDSYEIKAKRKMGIILRILIGFLYLLAIFVSLTFIFFVFELAQIPVTSLYIDTLNVAVIVFAALVVRQRAKELTVEDKLSIREFLIDILSVPVAEVGQWLANKWKEYNIVSIFFMALIDMPFSTLTSFIENWSSFVKERKSEIH